jgi:hypothetical protein
VNVAPRAHAVASLDIDLDDLSDFEDTIVSAPASPRQGDPEPASESQAEPEEF